MRQRNRGPTFLLTISLTSFLAFFSLYFSRAALRAGDQRLNLPAGLSKNSFNLDVHYALREDREEQGRRRASRLPKIADETVLLSTVSVLLPDWEILVIVPPDKRLPPVSVDGYLCLFQNNATSPASFFGVKPFTNQTTFKCPMPNSVRQAHPFWEPILIKSPTRKPPPFPSPELIRWTFLAYEALSTEDDIVVFAKGLNHRQGSSRQPSEFRCVFGDPSKDDAVRTAVTSSVQEVFRCRHPDLAAINSRGEKSPKIKVTLEIVDKNNLTVPSVAYYLPWRPQNQNPNPEPKSLLCACTMVYNVAKFLKEWVMYHSKIGVAKFILYDNASDDDIEAVVAELNQQGFRVERLLWIWPKTQEAGFSHSVAFFKNSCTWMMYVDVDEFVFSPSWRNSLQTSDRMLKSLLPATANNPIGQVSINCLEYGPSQRLSHPVEGVTQGYTCRRSKEQRHKSIVLLDAVDSSLLNVIHHFQLKGNFSRKQLQKQVAAVNHYKYQAWPEFRTKFRRRVSSYVVDWTKEANPTSKDRAPGLGFQPIEPKDWFKKFCEVRDDRLRLLTHRWFGSRTPDGYRMAWQR